VTDPGQFFCLVCALCLYIRVIARSRLDNDHSTSSAAWCLVRCSALELLRAASLRFEAVPVDRAQLSAIYALLMSIRIWCGCLAACYGSSPAQVTRLGGALTAGELLPWTFADQVRVVSPGCACCSDIAGLPACRRSYSRLSYC